MRRSSLYFEVARFVMNRPNLYGKWGFRERNPRKGGHYSHRLPAVKRGLARGLIRLFAGRTRPGRCGRIRQYVLHLGRQLLETKGLGQEVEVFGLLVVTAESFLGIARHED